MAGEKVAKDASLVIVFVALALLVLPLDVRLGAGLTSGDAATWRRLGYMWLHVGVVHALLNVWCLLSVVFLFRVGVGMLLLAVGIAVSVPCFALADIPTLGLSGVCYALLGMVSWQVARKRRWHLWVVSFIVAGLLIPGVAVGVHVWCYAAGVVAGVLVNSE